MLLDLVMAPLTGHDVLAKLRAFSRLPVIVFTAQSDRGATAMEEGATSFIAKPFLHEDLAKKIEDTLDRHGNAY